ncbi:hypothetical protein [Corallococcus sicarius]|uniref:hypothetical protein n=1 Tax=Corallococcus sicarius TaxID=2316726 RepID=UPI0011C3B181|nr:hypothetical protein [Corallococcus sicarius]
MGEVHNAFLDACTSPNNTAQADFVEKLDGLADCITRVAQISKRQKVSTEEIISRVDKDKLKAAASIEALELSVESAQSTTGSTKEAREYEQVFEDNILFTDLHHRLADAIVATGNKRLLVLIDEWTTMPADVQPYFAEFLKRSFLPIARATLKIASLEYRSRFSVTASRNAVLGFELGGDISANVDLDDYFVYDRNPEGVTAFFDELLYRHVVNELPDKFLGEQYNIGNAASFRTTLFTEKATFIELVRASEGVARDLINITNTSFFDALRRGREKIDIKAVREAARQWYETDKAVNLSADQYSILLSIIKDVIGDRRARSFMVERAHSGHPMIQSLFDYRIIHLIARGYSDKENPGLRYNIYTLDYGTYVDLIQTKSQPELDLVYETEEQEGRIVPYDDKRSIRRIILNPKILLKK